MKRGLFGDNLIAGEIVIIGAAAAVHLAAAVFGWSFGRCAMVLGGLVCAVPVCGVLFYGIRSGKRLSGSGDDAPAGKLRFQSRTECCLYAVFTLIFLSQLAFICMGDSNYRQGDMTVETVGSILETDGVYQVNPMTGLPYTGGIPLRLKVLCLPTLYAGLSKMTGMSPADMVWKVIPVVTLISSYTAFAMLAVSLFPKAGEKAYREKRASFMTVVSLLMWVGAYQAGVDGFQLLCGGWMGVTIRNLVLLPWLLSLCIRKKWLWAVLCIPAEACIVWTLYGCGVCLPFLLALGILQRCGGKSGTAAAKDRKSQVQTPV